MWRSMFIAVGIFLCLLGGEFLACDHLVLRGAVREAQADNPVQTIAYSNAPAASQRKIYVPKDWMPWTLLASGSIVLIYSARPKN